LPGRDRLEAASHHQQRIGGAEAFVLLIIFEEFGQNRSGPEQKRAIAVGDAGVKLRSGIVEGIAVIRFDELSSPCRM